MPYKFRKHYTRDEAREILPKVRQWLERLREHRTRLEQTEDRLRGLLAPGRDLGGDLVNQWVKTMALMQESLAEFIQREIQIKDLDRGLLDFPAIIGGREVFLCWEQDEDDIEFWHDLDTGFAGRERL